MIVLLQLLMADDDCFVLMVDVEVVAVEILVTVVGSVDEFTLFSVVDGFFMGVFFTFFWLPGSILRRLFY